jgi:hypothetical protein
MKQIIRFLLLAWWVFALSASPLLAADSLRFSGRYSAERSKTASGATTDSTLEVTQNQAKIEVTRVELGKITTSRCPFNGDDGTYITSGGASGTCKAQLKGKNLIIESVVVTRPQPTAGPIRIHTKERWQLSADFKVLTIKSDVDFPDFPSEISAAVAGTTSAIAHYTRTEGQ